MYQSPSFSYGGIKKNNNKKSEIPDVQNHAPLKSQLLDRQSRIKNQQSKSRIIIKKKSAVVVYGCRHKATS